MSIKQDKKRIRVGIHISCMHLANGSDYFLVRNLEPMPCESMHMPELHQKNTSSYIFIFLYSRDWVELSLQYA